ncbi:MAG: molecular chaperone TorD family protein [Treponema sp.]|jgi:anaerobic dimethyl sulfoxide reductase subunit A|nr:molecular chaperone TorD family protein [Treponema sp.]
MYFFIILLFIFLSIFSCIAGVVLVNTLLLKSPGAAKMKSTKTLFQAWEQCHYFALFFLDFPAWLSSYSPGERSEFNPEERAALFEEYDALFKGVRRDFHIPPWTSVEKPGDPLLNSRTLEIVRFYNARGYEAKGIDGNPPDFIGEEFRFLCYLWASALGERKNGRETTETLEAALFFAGEYLKPAAERTAFGIHAHGTGELFKKIGRELEGLGFPVLSEKFPAGRELRQDIKQYYCYENYLNGGNSARDNKPARFIKTAGRNN